MEHFRRQLPRLSVPKFVNKTSWEDWGHPTQEVAVLSDRLTPEERQLLRLICTALDGVPFTEKAAILRASVEGMRAPYFELRTPYFVHSPPFAGPGQLHQQAA